MSREREKQRKKRSELARQLGVSKGEVEEAGALVERERVTRPALQLVAHKNTGLLGKLQRELPIVAALYLVDAKGARLVRALELGGERHEIEKLTYWRPAHFVVVVLAVAEPARALEELAAAKLRLDGLDLASEAIASAEWETPRRVRIEGVSAPQTGAALSIRGLVRVAARYEFPLEKSVATISIEI